MLAVRRATAPATVKRLVCCYTTGNSERVTREDIGDGIAVVTLNRPDKMNGLDMDMFEAIVEQAHLLREDKSVRAIILRGEGKAFCTGLDVKSVMSNPMNMSRLLNKDREPGPNDPETGNLAQNVGYLWRKIPAPVIASLHGMCFGGGLQIAMGADFRYSSPECKFSIMEAKWGLIPDMSGSITLRELVRMDVLKELTMTGRIIGAAEAKDVGLVTRVEEDPYAAAVKTAREVVERSPDSVAATKELFHRTWLADEKTALAEETRLQKTLLGSYNQMTASSRNVMSSPKVPYKKRQDYRP